MRKVNYKEKGITLIALVITIIILLILAGVTLTTALSQNGLFERAKYAGEKYKESEADEAEKLGEVEEEIDKIIDGENPTTGKIPEEMQVGDVVHYTPVTTETSYKLTSDKSGYDTDQTITQQNLTWKVLGKNADSVEIMGVPTEGGEVSLKGATGYNNGVYLLDEMCKTLYSNIKLGVEARSIDIEDIESKMSEYGIEMRGYYNDYENDIQYGYTRMYSGDEAWYPNLAKYENILGIDDGEVNTVGIGKNDDGTKVGEIEIPLIEKSSDSINSRTKASNNIEVRMTYYEAELTPFDFDDGNFFYSFIKGAECRFWFASRYSRCKLSDAEFRTS